jgi:predicted nucleic acid-binding protein
MSYWDALLWATSKLNSVPTYLTEDLSHGQVIEGVRILNPLRDDFDLALLD